MCTSISVLQWNILADHLAGASPTLGGFDNVTPQMLDWATRKAKIIATIQDYDPEVIALQECDHFDEIAKELHYTGYFAMKPATVATGNPEGVALFVRQCYGLKVTRCHSFTYVDLEGRPANQPALIVELRTSDVRCIVATTHLKATKTPEGEAIRQHQISQLLSYIGRIRRTPDTPVILLGDLNAMPVANTEVGAPLTYNTIINSDLGFKSAFDTALPTTIKSRGGKLTSRCIDYIMYAGNATVIDAEHGYYETPKTTVIDKSVGCKTRCEMIIHSNGYTYEYLIPREERTNETYHALELEAANSPKPPRIMGENIQISEGFPSDHTCLYATFEITRGEKVAGDAESYGDCDSNDEMYDNETDD
jgi:endonuclease/exonuclease/phosphatase family metal-dependent hydrolase